MQPEQAQTNLPPFGELRGVCDEGDQQNVVDFLLASEVGVVRLSQPVLVGHTCPRVCIRYAPTNSHGRRLLGRSRWMPTGHCRPRSRRWGCCEGWPRRRRPGRFARHLCAGSGGADVIWCGDSVRIRRSRLARAKERQRERERETKERGGGPRSQPAAMIMSVCCLTPYRGCRT